MSGPSPYSSSEGMPTPGNSYRDRRSTAGPDHRDSVGGDCSWDFGGVGGRLSRPRQPLGLVRSSRCASRLAPELCQSRSRAPSRTASKFPTTRLPSPVARSPSTPPGLELSTTVTRNILRIDRHVKVYSPGPALVKSYDGVETRRTRHRSGRGDAADQSARRSTFQERARVAITSSKICSVSATSASVSASET